MAQVSVPDRSSSPLFTRSQTRTTQYLLSNQSTPYCHHPQLLLPSARIPCHLGHHLIILATSQASPSPHLFHKSTRRWTHSFGLQHPERVHSPSCPQSTWISKTLTGNTTFEDATRRWTHSFRLQHPERIHTPSCPCLHGS